MPNYHKKEIYSIATSWGGGGGLWGGAWEDLNPVSPNKGEQALSTEQQGSCITIELLNQTSKKYQDISKERKEDRKSVV